jgi:hypothetical protein
MAAISPCDSELKESAWQTGASMYVAGQQPLPDNATVSLRPDYRGFIAIISGS